MRDRSRPQIAVANSDCAGVGPGSASQCAAMTVNRRTEIFKTARGSKLSALRGRSAGEPTTTLVGTTGKVAAYDDDLPPRRRVRLGPPVEDEAALEYRDAPRYSEPND